MKQSDLGKSLDPSARALRAPIFLGSRQMGRCAPPRPSQLPASYSIPKNRYKKLWNSGRPCNGLSRNKMLSFRLKFGGRPRHWIFSFHWTTEAIKMRSPLPSPPLVSINFCDFLTSTDAVIENPQKYLAAEKYY
jgi:hypothetical protein